MTDEVVRCASLQRYVHRQRCALHYCNNLFSFYRVMLCIRGTSHGPVSVCLSVRPSVRYKSVFY